MFRDRAPWADKAFWWVAPVVILASAAGGAYYYFHTRQGATEEAAKVETPAVAAEPAIRHPVPHAASAQNAQPLPALSESDAPLRASLEQMFGDMSVRQFLVPEDLVRRIVVTIDNLPRQKVAVEKRPVKPLAGQTATTVSGDLITLSDENYARYAPFVQLVRNADTQALADLYVHFYPLFQQAYEDLGYPDRYFNDRLVETIDSLLAAPDVAGPITLKQPRVFHEFADPQLERLPAGQKVLIRMGPQNAAVVKTKLRELRKAVTRAGPGGPENAAAGATDAGVVSPTHGGLHHWL